MKKINYSTASNRSNLSNNSDEIKNIRGMRNILMMVFLLSFGIIAYGQEPEGKSLDSITPAELKKRARAIIADKFPSTRIIDIQYEQFSDTDYDSEFKRKKLEQGTFSQSRFRVALNVPLIRKPTWTLSVSGRYRFESFDLSNVRNVSEDYPSMPLTKSEDYHYLSGSINYSKTTKLFGKPFIYNASVVFDGSDEGYERVTGSLLATIILKKTERTTIGLGAIAFIDPASQFPVLPVFVYEHKFLGSKWILDATLPRYVYMRRELLQNGRISLGTAFEGTNFYTYNNSQPDFASVNSFSQNELKTGFMYEYHISKSLIATLRGGFATIFSGQLTESNKKQDDNDLMVSQDMNMYFNVGFSFNPFK